MIRRFLREIFAPLVIALVMVLVYAVFEII